MNLHRSSPRWAVAGGLAAALLLAVTAGCTSDGDAERPQPSALPSRSVGSPATLQAKPVPMDVQVGTVVGGRLKGEQRQRLVKQVSHTLSDYFDAAFLAGEYPRADFSGALARFSRGAASRAGSDRDLLTNAGIGEETEAVVARSKQARLDVLVPRSSVVGLTARVRLVFVQQRTDGADQRVTVKGRLLMSRKESGPWQIFGYDVTRSSEPVAKGGAR